MAFAVGIVKFLPIKKVERAVNCILPLANGAMNNGTKPHKSEDSVLCSCKFRKCLKIPELTKMPCIFSDFFSTQVLSGTYGICNGTKPNLRCYEL